MDDLDEKQQYKHDGTTKIRNKRSNNPPPEENGVISEEISLSSSTINN